ncbi:hypothetical protein Acr_15g0015450 [Actinidia rufa]|uniref:F-box domain-containing protein n=1 Tax=Actinidia rufa TaxID=165716 RepID=A0A7J0FWU4_9ERIC|nr:hypothetical protein Acr_15g0015450 [Actinidia rufa]
MVHKKRDGYNFEDGRTSKWCWSYLPVGVLGMIMGRLSPVDQIRFRAVCKDWRLASSSSQPSPRLPWLMTRDWVWSESGDIVSSNKFHMPFHRHTHTSMHELDGQNWDDIHGASVCTSKYGWLLLQKSKNGFVYNPFTREMLKLPKIDIAFNRITFSSVPTSTDCLFFAIESSKKSSRYKIKICICSLGAQKWTTKNFNGIGKVAEDVVYNNGIFYCVFSGGVLGTYNVALQDWKVLTGMAPITDVVFWHRTQMVDADGELLLVGTTLVSGVLNCILGIHRTAWKNSGSNPLNFRLDSVEGEPVNVEGLDTLLVFVRDSILLSCNWVTWLSCIIRDSIAVHRVSNFPV